MPFALHPQHFSASRDEIYEISGLAINLRQFPILDQHFRSGRDRPELARDLDLFRLSRFGQSTLEMDQLFLAFPPSFDFFLTFATTHAILLD
jgi:hypothetical protein